MPLSASACRSVYTAGIVGIIIQVCAGAGGGTGTDFRAGAGSGTGTDFRTGTGCFDTVDTTSTGNFAMFGTPSMPVPETSVNSVRHQCRYRKLR